MSEERPTYRVDRLGAYYGVTRPAATLPRPRIGMWPISTPPASGFGQTLRAFRERMRLSQSDLARRTGVTPSHVCRLENGQRTPSREAVLHLATALELGRGDRDRLLMTAGMLTPALEDPLVQRLGTLFVDPQVTDQRKRQLRQAVALLVEATHSEAQP